MMKRPSIRNCFGWSIWKEWHDSSDPYKNYRYQIRFVNEILSKLDVHEIENLIPVNFLEHIDEWNGESGRKKEAFDFISGDPDIMPYFDLKKGVQKSSVIGDDLYIFGKRCYQHNHIMVEAGTYEELYAQTDKYVYPGLNEQALKHTLSYLDATNNPEQPVLMGFQRRNWEMIGEALLNFCVAHNQEVIY